MADTHTTTVCAKLADDELETLVALEKFERLRRSDVIRRAIRHYALHLGVAPEPARNRKPKTT